MWPIALRLGEFQVGSYGVLIGIGILICLWGARTLGRRDGLNPKSVNDLGLGVFVCGLLGSMLLGVGINYVNGIEMDWSELRNAGVIHGGLIGGLVGLVALVRVFRLPLKLVLDAYSPLIALGQGIGRLGCFAAGCCFGRATDLPWSVVFSDPVAHELGGVPLGIHLHPVQIYDAVFHFGLSALLLALHRRSILRGRLFPLWCMGEGLGRLSMEFFRGDLGRGFWLGVEGLSTGRLTASLFVLLGAALLFKLAKEPALGGAARPGHS